MNWLIEQLLKEWAVIKQAPLSFLIMLVLCLLLAYLLLKYIYGERLEHKDDIIESLNAKLGLKPSDESALKTSVETPPPITDKAVEANHSETLQRLNDRIAELEREKAERTGILEGLNKRIRELEDQKDSLIIEVQQRKVDLFSLESDLQKLRDELDRYKKPLVDITLEEETLTHLSQRRLGYYLIVSSPVTINGLRMEIEELKVGDKTYYNVPLRETGDAEPYQLAFCLEPEEKKSFLVATKDDSGNVTLYTATPEISAVRLPTVRFIIVARGINTLPLRKSLYFATGMNGKWNVSLSDQLLGDDERKGQVTPFSSMPLPPKT